MEQHTPHEAELGSAQETNMVDGNTFAREFRELATNLRPRELEREPGSDVDDYLRGASETFAFVAMRLSGDTENPEAYDRWLDELRERAAGAVRRDG
jgi:hypothetical protein